MYKECVPVCSSNMINKCCYFIELMMAIIILIIFSLFSMMILVIFQNQTKLRHTISGRAYILLKGALILFCFRFFVEVVGSTTTLILVTTVNEERARARKISGLLLLPFCKKIIELLWQKIFFDKKCITGKMRRNRDTHQITFVL